jgi:hypothetical protein
MRQRGPRGRKKKKKNSTLSYLWHSHTPLLLGVGHRPSQGGSQEVCPSLVLRDETKHLSGRPRGLLLPNCVIADRVLKIVIPLHFSYF